MNLNKPSNYEIDVIKEKSYVLVNILTLMHLLSSKHIWGGRKRGRERERERWKIFGLCNDSVLSCVCALLEKGAIFAARCKYFQVPKKCVYCLRYENIYGWCLDFCAID